MFLKTSFAFTSIFGLTLAPSLPLLNALPVLAIAPGVQQADYCANYTAGRYRLQTNEVTVTNVRRTGSNFRVSWSIPHYQGRGYCLVSNRNKMIRFEVQRSPQLNGENSGPNSKRFNNLPGYGDVIVNRGLGAVRDRQYFLVRVIRNDRTHKWYARCGYSSDQVYDHRGKYVGYNRRLTVMFPYVCEVSPLSHRPPQPR